MQMHIPGARLNLPLCLLLFVAPHRPYVGPGCSVILLGDPNIAVYMVHYYDLCSLKSM